MTDDVHYGAFQAAVRRREIRSPRLQAGEEARHRYEPAYAGGRKSLPEVKSVARHAGSHSGAGPFPRLKAGAGDLSPPAAAWIAPGTPSSGLRQDSRRVWRCRRASRRFWRITGRDQRSVSAIRREACQFRRDTCQFRREARRLRHETCRLQHPACRFRHRAR